MLRLEYFQAKSGKLFVQSKCLNLMSNEVLLQKYDCGEKLKYNKNVCILP